MKEKEMIVEGIPVLIKERGRQPRSIRVKLRQGRHKPVKDRSFAELDSRQKQALKNFADLGCDPKMKKEAGEAAGYSPNSHGGAVMAMDRLLERRPIIKNIEKECKAKYEKGADEKVAQVLVEQLEAVHPLAKGEKKDNLAIMSSAKEINKLKDNYPAKKVDIREVGFHLHFTPDDLEAAKQYRELTNEDS